MNTLDFPHALNIFYVMVVAHHKIINHVGKDKKLTETRFVVALLFGFGIVQLACPVLEINKNERNKIIVNHGLSQLGR